MRLVVARVGRAHGIRGEVTVEVRTDVPELRFAVGRELFVVPPAGRAPARPGLPDAVTVAGARDHNGVLLLAFEGVLDRTAAEALRGCVLEADVRAEDEREPDAWYDHELVGLAAHAPDGALLGEVIAVEHPGAQDLLVVRRPDGERRLVPLVTAIVPEVDLAGGRVVVDAPAGLLYDVEEE